MVIELNKRVDIPLPSALALAFRSMEAHLATPPVVNLKDVLLSVERTLIQSVLVACEWNQRRTAEALGVLPTTLSEKIQRLGIQPPQDRWSRENRNAARRLPRKTKTGRAIEAPQPAS